MHALGHIGRDMLFPPCHGMQCDRERGELVLLPCQGICVSANNVIQDGHLYSEANGVIKARFLLIARVEEDSFRCDLAFNAATMASLGSGAWCNTLNTKSDGKPVSDATSINPDHGVTLLPFQGMHQSL